VIANQRHRSTRVNSEELRLRKNIQPLEALVAADLEFARLGYDPQAQVLVFGCAYSKVADDSCSATTSRRRRDEWIDEGIIESLRRIAA
jgi:hypothetical protein